jgi:hypothetical protein
MLKRTINIVAVTLLIFNATMPIMSQIDKEIRFTCVENELFGVLTLPNAKKPYPAIILLHGSDRGVADNYKQYANELIRSGFAVLTYDSPGKGKSTGSTVGETFEYRYQEAISAINYLQSRQDIKPDGIGLWGISQGGWICQMAAATSDNVAFIIPVSGPGVTVPEQEIFRVKAQSEAAGFSKNDVEQAVLIRRLLVDLVLSEPQYVKKNKKDAKNLGSGPWNELINLAYSKDALDPKNEMKIFIEVLREIKDENWSKYLMIEYILSMLENIEPDAWESIKKSFELTMKFDPANYLTKIHVPVLAIFGDADTSVPVKESIKIYKQALKKAKNKDVTIKVFPNTDHGINVEGKPAPGFYSTMIDWLINLKL